MLQKNRNTITWIIAAFLLLCAVSAYRQISLRFFISDPVRPAVVYFVYLVLLAGWWGAIRNRVVQSSMRVYLLAEHAVMLFGITIRFLQDTFLPYSAYIDTSFMRLSGYATIVPMLLIPLLGLFAAFGLGKPEEYRVSRSWHYLLAPAGMLILLTLTNESHGFVFHALEEEAQFLYFQPNWGIIIIFAWAFVLEISRIVLILLRSRSMRAHTRYWIVPFIIAVFMMVYIIPYLAGSFVAEFELVEFIVFLFFLEIMVWESCILIGMVPVNTRYKEVFNRSTVAMQVVNREGKPYLKSTCAPELSADVFVMLTQQKKLRTPEGQELNLHPIKGGYAVWQSDVSQIIEVMDELQHSVERLENESEILSQEIKIQSEATAVKEKNRIYNQLTTEVGEQLALLRNLLDQQKQVEDKSLLFWKICLLGTYIKRRCNLRLIEQSDGRISNNDLCLCYNELTGCLQQMGVETDVIWNTENTLDPDFAVFTLDLFEFLLEYVHFELQSIEAAFETERSFSVCIRTNNGLPDIIPDIELQRINRESYEISWQTSETDYKVTVRGYGG